MSSHYRLPTISSRAHGIALILIVVFGLNVLHAQAEQHRDSLFGVPLDEKTLLLVTEVEQLYGNPIQSDWLPDAYPMPGKSKVGKDGTPIILINPSSGRKPDVIVHELYHLILRSRGYPADFKWLYPKNLDTPEKRPDFQQISFDLYDPILHYVFYPEAQVRLGINAGNTFEEDIRLGFSNGSAPNRFAGMNAEATALTYYKLRLELADKELFQKFVNLLEMQGKHNEVAMGKRLAGIVERESHHLSRDSAVSAFVECLNIFYEGRYTFAQSQGPWTPRRIGKHIAYSASIEMRVARPTISAVPK